MRHLIQDGTELARSGEGMESGGKVSRHGHVSMFSTLRA
jgi:hypothetical protein